MCGSSGGFNQDARKAFVEEGQVFVDGEMLGVARAQVSNVWVRQAGMSYNGRIPICRGVFYSLR